MRNVDDLLKLPQYALTEIREIFDERHPFGPSSSGDFREFPDLEDIVFSTENQIWKEYLTKPRIILGRKGSGKSSVLGHTKRSNHYKIVHKLSTSQVAEDCALALFQGADNLKHVSAESSGKVWREIINASLMSEILSVDSKTQFPRIEKYFEVSGLQNHPGRGNVVGLLRNMRRGTSPTVSGEGTTFGVILQIIIESVLHFRKTSGFEYEAAVTEMDQYLGERNWKTVVILDSVEEYPLDDYQYDAVIRGMLRCAGSYGSRFRDLRLAIPAELYYNLEEKSSNHAKDFENVMVLHWSPIELLRIIAWRYLIYLAGYDQSRLLKFRGIDLSKRDEVHQVFEDFFPANILNRTGREEDSLAYVLRHTQLLPRQIIRIFNEAFSTARPNVPIPEDVASSSVVKAIEVLESSFCVEVFNAFKSKYPYAAELCEACIPNLPRFFTEKELEDVYVHRGKAVMSLSMNQKLASFRVFKRTLFEIGAIGRATKANKETEIYSDADFEYAIPGKLHSSPGDILCLHPAFSGTFETTVNDKSDIFVYPHMRLYDVNGGRRLRVK